MHASTSYIHLAILLYPAFLEEVLWFEDLTCSALFILLQAASSNFGVLLALMYRKSNLFETIATRTYFVFIVNFYVETS